MPLTAGVARREVSCRRSTCLELPDALHSRRATSLGSQRDSSTFSSRLTRRPLVAAHVGNRRAGHHLILGLEAKGTSYPPLVLGVVRIRSLSADCCPEAPSPAEATSRIGVRPGVSRCSGCKIALRTGISRFFELANRPPTRNFEVVHPRESRSEPECRGQTPEKGASTHLVEA